MLPETPKWLTPAVVSLLFIEVAAGGIILGSEYRRRIRYLKAKREEYVTRYVLFDPFPPTNTQIISEIHVLYLVLAFTSSTGALSAWVHTFPESDLARWSLIVVSSCFIVYGVVKAIECLNKSK